MHIPDAYLSPGTELATFAAMIPVWVVASRRTAKELTSRQAPLLSIGAAFCFAIQMFNIPAIGGTTAHALGAVLLAILVGPWAAVLGMTLTLAIQALMFGDGGVLSLGANCLDMAVIAPFVGYGVFRLLGQRADPGAGRWFAAAAFGAYAGTAAASLMAGLLLGIQPLVAHDALGHALYCPFGLNVTVPAMVITHLITAAPAESFITVAALAYLYRAFPELIASRSKPRIGATVRLVRVLAWVLLLTPIGLLASGSAFGEWDLSQIARMVGYTPAGMAGSRVLVHPLLPDYGFAGAAGTPWEAIGYLASAVLGGGAVAIFLAGFLRRRKIEPVAYPEVERPTAMPEWMRSPNPALPAPHQMRAGWLEKTILKMHRVVEKTVAADSVARSSGFLQSIHPTAKGVGFLSALIAAGLARSPWLLVGLLAIVAVSAFCSNVPIGTIGPRVAGAVLFFGVVVAGPLSLEYITPGPVLFRTLGVGFSEQGLQLAGMILLRLAAGISLAILWNLTTPWHQLLRSLGSLGVPRVILSMATLTYRYVFVMMETLADMVTARTSRQVGACDKRQARMYAGAGTAVLFAKSLALTEETHLAMQSRGFDGRVRHARRANWGVADFGTAFVGIITLASVLLQGIFFHAL